MGGGRYDALEEVAELGSGDAVQHGRLCGGDLRRKGLGLLANVVRNTEQDSFDLKRHGGKRDAGTAVVQE